MTDPGVRGRHARRGCAGRRLAAVVLAFLCSTYSARAEVLLVKGTSSAPEGAERTYAARVTETLALWLGEMDVPCRVITDEAMASSSLPERGVMLLGYNPYPSAKELSAISAFTRRGGKLIVCYGAEPKLAALLQVDMGEYKAGLRPDAWRVMRFDKAAARLFPSAVVQPTRNIRPVAVRGGVSRVIARWEGPDGKETGDPACVVSDNGYWLTYLLKDDGDTWSKKQLLLAMIGTYEPVAWRRAAESTLTRIPFGGHPIRYEEAVKRVEGRISGGRFPEAAAALGRAGQARDNIARLMGERRHASAFVEGRRLWSELLAAYAGTVPSGRNEMHGVWDHDGLGLYPGDWEKTCRELRSCGISDLFVNVLWPGSSHYDGRIAPPSPLFRALGDQLQGCLAAAHASGMKVHAWKVCWRLDRMDREQVRALRAAGLCQVSAKGEPVDWRCPSHPDNLRREKDEIRELLQAYDVDGIHLDYIRYRDSGVCFCGGCRSRFEAAVKRRVGRWPADVTSGAMKEEYSRWRAGRVTALVRDVSSFARQIRPGIKVSAAVYGNYPHVAGSIGQDWGKWVAEGLVDFVCPMNYTEKPDEFRNLVTRQTGLPNAGLRIVPGIGATATESRLDAVQVLEQVQIQRALGAGGWVLFDLNGVLSGEILPYLPARAE